MSNSVTELSFSRPKNLYLVFIAAIVLTFALLLGFAYFPINLTYPVTKIYYADNISPAHQIVIDRFNSEYEGEIKVITIDLPFDKFNTNLRKELLARSLRNQNSLIDVFAIDQVWISRFAIWAEPLNSYFPKTTLQSLIPKVLSNAYCDSILVSIPLHTDVGVLYYRRDLLKELDPSGDLERAIESSLSWTDFIKLGQEYGSPNKFYLFQAFNYEGLAVNFMEIVGPQKSEEIYDLDSMKINVDITDEGSEFLRQLIYAYKLSPEAVLSFDENRTYEYAFQYDIPFMRGWPTYIQKIKNTSLGDKIGIAALPHSPGQPSSSVLGGWNLMLSKHSKVKREAAIFLNYMLSPEVQQTMLQVSGYLPVHSDIYLNPDILREIDYLPFLKQLVDNGFYRPAVPQYTYLSKRLADRIHQRLTQLPDAD